jgi:hypothetical protein
MIRTASVPAAAMLLALALAVPGLAAGPSSTSEVTAGPPAAGAWQVFEADTGPRTASDLYGSSASRVNGFGDAYRRVWTTPNQVLVDRVERFTSVVWSGVRYTESKNAAAKSSSHTSYKTIPGFTPYAYETIDPADAQGFIADTIVFSKGDYVAVIALAAKESVPHDVVMDQARRQLDLLPMATVEYQSIGAGVLAGGGVLLVLLVVVVVGAIVLARRRSPATGGPILAGSQYGAPAGVAMSPEGRHWWDGLAWQDAELTIPPGAQRSPDGSHWWDGVRWRPAPPGYH